MNIHSFSFLPSFFLLFSEDFEEYNSYLCSSVAIFRLAQISGDPRLFLHLFLSLSACLLHLPPFDGISTLLLCCVRMINYRPQRCVYVQYNTVCTYVPLSLHVVVTHSLKIKISLLITGSTIQPVKKGVV